MMAITKTVGEAVRFSLEYCSNPPSYDYEPRKFNIQPREDEGQELLPAYSCAISLENVFKRKMELEGAFNKAQRRRWGKVYATLQGTALTFHKHKTASRFSRDGGRRKVSLPDLPAGSRRGGFVKSYNLQHADVGIAVDYFKKSYVIRIRAEADQFLLSCTTIETFILWLQSLYAAIDLAPPLEDREQLREIIIPRRRRRRVVEIDGNADAAIAVTAIVTPTPTEATRPPSPEMRDANSSLPSPSPSPTPTEPETTDLIPLPTPTSSPSNRPTWSLQRAQSAFASSTDLHDAHPSIVPETGKWQPEHQWSLVHDLIYARRCFAALTLSAPRKSNLVIMAGKLWVADWSEATLTRWDPPGYAE